MDGSCNASCTLQPATAWTKRTQGGRMGGRIDGCEVGVGTSTCELRRDEKAIDGNSLLVLARGRHA